MNLNKNGLENFKKALCKKEVLEEFQIFLKYFYEETSPRIEKGFLKEKCKHISFEDSMLKTFEILGINDWNDIASMSAEVNKYKDEDEYLKNKILHALCEYSLKNLIKSGDVDDRIIKGRSTEEGIAVWVNSISENKDEGERYIKERISYLNLGEAMTLCEVYFRSVEKESEKSEYRIYKEFFNVIFPFNHYRI